MATQKEKRTWETFAKGGIDLADGFRAEYQIGGFDREQLSATVHVHDAHGNLLHDWRGIRITEPCVGAILSEGIALDILEAMRKVREGAEAARLLALQENAKRELQEAQAALAALESKAKALGVNPHIMAGREIKAG